MFYEGQQIGLYTLLRKIGRGGFGEVWLAERKSKFVTTKVAVKLPLDEQVDYEAIQLEAQLWEQATGHPNILAIIDAHEYDGQVVIVSEYAPDGSLSDKLKGLGKFPVKEAVEIIIGVLNGLEYLHSKRIIHRDIKPQNILLQGNTPKLADFGISRIMQTTEISSTIIGTDAYMSPESFEGSRTFQTDIWSVGVVLYQLLNGRLPFPQQNPAERMFSILLKEFAPLSEEIPKDLIKIVEKSLAKSYENRYQSAVKMREDLQIFLSNFLPLLQIVTIKPIVLDDFDEIETAIPQRADISAYLFKIEVSKIISILLHIIAQKRLEDSLLKNERLKKIEISKIISIISKAANRKKLEEFQRNNEIQRKIEIGKIISIISQVATRKKIETDLQKNKVLKNNEISKIISIISRIITFKKLEDILMFNQLKNLK